MSHQDGLGNNGPESTGLNQPDDDDDRMQKKRENVAHATDGIKLKKPRIQDACAIRLAQVENAIKAVLLNRVMTSEDRDGGFIVSFEGAFHGRTLGSLAVTHRKKARLGFPTFDWPHIPFPVEEAGSPKETARREERSLKRVWELLVSGRLSHSGKSKDIYRREMDALDEFLAQPGQDLNAFVHAQRANLSPDVVRRSRRVAGVLVEPIQGEGGVRLAS